MALNLLKTMDDGIWKDYDADVSFKIRPFTPKIARDTKKANTSSKKDGGKLIEVVNNDRWNIDILDYVIQDWKGIEDGSSNPLSCIRENKVILDQKFSSIIAWVMEISSGLAEEIASEKEIAEKN